MTALITGASSGMGAEFARHFAGMGYDLALVSNRGDELAAVAVDIRRECGVVVDVLCTDLAAPGAAGTWLYSERFVHDRAHPRSRDCHIFGDKGLP